MKQLKIMYTNYLLENEPQINTVDTYFTDAIFVINNPSIGLDLYDIITDDDKIAMYHQRLIQHFINKGWLQQKAKRQARDYVNKLVLFKKLIETQ